MLQSKVNKIKLSVSLDNSRKHTYHQDLIQPHRKTETLSKATEMANDSGESQRRTFPFERKTFLRHRLKVNAANRLWF